MYTAYSFLQVLWTCHQNKGKQLLLCNKKHACFLCLQLATFFYVWFKHLPYIRAYLLCYDMVYTRQQNRISASLNFSEREHKKKTNFKETQNWFKFNMILMSICLILNMMYISYKTCNIWTRRIKVSPYTNIYYQFKHYWNHSSPYCTLYKSPVGIRWSRVPQFHSSSLMTQSQVHMLCGAKWKEECELSI